MSKPIVSFVEQAVRDELRELARKTIEETINAMLDEEATSWWALRPTSAPARGRHTAPAATSAGSPPRRARSRSGYPMRFATAVVERRKRRETSVEEAIIEMYLAGVSTRRIEDVSEIPWGAGVSAGMVGSIAEAFPEAKHQRCTVHFYRNALASTATCRQRSPNPSAPRPRPCSRPSTRWSPERHRRPKRRPWLPTWNR